MKSRLTTVASMAFAASLAPVASGQVLVNEAFEIEGSTSGFTANGNQMLFEGGNPGLFMGIPADSYFGLSLRTDEPGNPMLGNLSRHGGPIRITFDVRVTLLRSFFGDDIDPENFPLVLECFDDPANPEDYPVSVYIVGAGLPNPSDGWMTVQFVIPDPTQAALPAGWAGTGEEDPNTFEPRLPAHRTYASVLANVDRFQISTFRPGFFYGFNLWEAGFDNLRIEVDTPATCAADFNSDGNLDPDDLADYIACYFLPPCDGADFSGDGNVDPDDLADYIAAYFAGCE